MKETKKRFLSTLPQFKDCLKLISQGWLKNRHTSKCHETGVKAREKYVRPQISTQTNLSVPVAGQKHSTAMHQLQYLWTLRYCLQDQTIYTVK